VLLACINWITATQEMLRLLCFITVLAFVAFAGLLSVQHKHRMLWQLLQLLLLYKREFMSGITARLAMPHCCCCCCCYYIVKRHCK
jgi:hypothetical protein